MSDARKLLFICSHNLQRSITAERLYEGFKGVEVRSAGTEREARVRVTEELVAWADIIFVMEPTHLQKLRSKFKAELAGKRLICLHIPDTYGYMSFRLVDLLKEKLSLYVPVPR